MTTLRDGMRQEQRAAAAERMVRLRTLKLAGTPVAMIAYQEDRCVSTIRKALQHAEKLTRLHPEGIRLWAEYGDDRHWPQEYKPR